MALAAAVCLAGALVYTSFSAASEAAEPSDLREGKSYDLTGKVVNDSIDRSGDELRFRIRDRDGTESVAVVYTGSVPDPFREGREVIITGQLEQGTLVGERDSLITKCPSKFTAEQNKT